MFALSISNTQCFESKPLSANHAPLKLFYQWKQSTDWCSSCPEDGWRQNQLFGRSQYH